MKTGRSRCRIKLCLYIEFVTCEGNRFMKNTEEELLLHMSRLESALDNLPFEVWLKDTDCNYLIVNKSIEEYFGKPKSEIIGKNNFELYPEEAAKVFNESDHVALEGKELNFFELDF